MHLFIVECFPVQLCVMIMETSKHDFGVAYSANETQYVQNFDAYATHKEASNDARLLQPRDRYFR